MLILFPINSRVRDPYPYIIRNRLFSRREEKKRKKERKKEEKENLTEKTVCQ